jgi:MFS family permease
MAQSAPSARSPRVRDLDHGRVAALLTALQFGYWAVLVYLPLFLSAAVHISMEGAGAALLAATLPMVLVPLIGGRLAMHWGWRRLFTIAFGLVVIGDFCLVTAALSDGPEIRLAAAVAGMAIIGVGAAVANPQLSGVALAVAPATQAGKASAVTFIVRQAGFAISIAALGLTLGAVNDAADFAQPFAPCCTCGVAWYDRGSRAASGEIPATQHTSLTVTSFQ